MKSLFLVVIGGFLAADSGPSTAELTKASISSANTEAPREVELVGSDYAFRIPSRLPAGLTTFRFRNEGKVRHELTIVRLKPGATLDEFIAREKQSKPTTDLLDGVVGVLFADPGKRSTSGLTVNLVAGRYAVQCALRDKPVMPKHFELGMYSVIDVRGSARSRPASAKADTVVATEYAFRFPPTLSPGHHTLVLRNEGKVPHELNIALLKQGATLDEFMKVRIANGNARALVDEGLGVLLTVGREAPLGRLEVNLLPGRDYRIMCVMTDDPKSPPHFALGMYGRIHVTGDAAKN